MEATLTFIKKRDGRRVPFDTEKIKTAVKKAFLANNINDELIFEKLTQDVVRIVDEKYYKEDLGGDSEIIPSVENIQDIVEIVLIQHGYAGIAKAYILYREKHKELREEKTLKDIRASKLSVIKRDGRLETFDADVIKYELEKMSFNLKYVDAEVIIEEVCKTVYSNIPTKEIHDLMVNCAKTHIEEHYNYSYLTARLVLDHLYEDVLGVHLYSDKIKSVYREKFVHYLEQGVDLELLTPELKNFDCRKIAAALEPARDLLFQYLGVQTIFDRYLLKTREKPQTVFELPQWMWMRVAMGLALKEKDKEERAIEFYQVLSNMYAVSSTPTLFNSGTTHPQMSSCYLNTVEDSMEGIFKNYADNAQLSKWAGGIGTDWTTVRATGAFIKGTNGFSQGIIPFLKIFNDVALAVNQGGKRKGAMAAYLEVWHRDIEEFIELKKNTGDERRRAHDIHTACFISDLFLQRVRQRGSWTLFSPDSVPELHELSGKKFKERYEFYEKQDIHGAKKINAVELWRKILTLLYETGHPWITFKDPINVRSPQDHVGVVHCSNLCTEITLNTSNEETAVCNLASLNLARMIRDRQLDEDLLSQTVTTVMRMLDNVIDNNFYPTAESKNSNFRHRPVGLGIMGYQDALYQLEIPFDSEDNLSFSDRSMELISYYAILASSNLARERGAYPSYTGSKWDRGLFPYDTMGLLEEERGEKLKVNHEARLNWSKVRENVKKYGIRNSNSMAIAPTATIANIAGVVPCVEPTYKNIYMKENLSGNFCVINRYLIDALEKLSLRNKTIINQIKLNNGSVQGIKEFSPEIRRRFKETFEIDQQWIIKAAALRQKWVDQSCSTNIFLKTTSGKVIEETYLMAWEYGLKTTYYLRTLGASQVSKTIADQAEIMRQIRLEVTEKPTVVVQDIPQVTVDIESPKEEKEESAAVPVGVPACKINDPDCEVCE